MSEPFDPYYKWLGIPPAEQPPNHYRLLGLNLFESDLEVISNAADQRMIHLRAYQTGKHSATSQKLLNEISTARLALLDASRKAVYDEGLRAALAVQSSAPVLVDGATSVVAGEAAPSAPPTPDDLAAAEAELQKRLTACNELQRACNQLWQQAWLARAAIVEAAILLRLRALVVGFPGGRIGLFAVCVLCGFGFGVISMAILTPRGMLVLLGAMAGLIFAATIAGHALFLPNDEALGRWQQKQREAAAGAPERLQTLKTELTEARRLVAEAQQHRDRLAAALAPPAEPVAGDAVKG